MGLSLAYLYTPATVLNPIPHFFNSHAVRIITNNKNIIKIRRNPVVSLSTAFNTPTASVSETDTKYESEVDFGEAESGKTPPPMRRRRRRYRRAYPGEKKGITEEMRFVAMELRSSGKPKSRKKSGVGGGDEKNEEKNNGGDGDTWQPSMEGLLKYLVDSELVFRTIERIVDESGDVSYAYFRKSGLERSDCILKDLEWLRSERGNVIPGPSNPGVTYVEYLKELGENSPQLFLCHFYNIYFSHIAGGQVIAKQVLDKLLLEGKELEFYKWDGDAHELLRGVREKLNALGEHWSRGEKNKCLREATKSFGFLGQIVRLIIL